MRRSILAALVAALLIAAPVIAAKPEPFVLRTTALNTSPEHRWCLSEDDRIDQSGAGYLYGEFRTTLYFCNYEADGGYGPGGLGFHFLAGGRDNGPSWYEVALIHPNGTITYGPKQCVIPYLNENNVFTGTIPGGLYTIVLTAESRYVTLWIEARMAWSTATWCP